MASTSGVHDGWTSIRERGVGSSAGRPERDSLPGRHALDEDAVLTPIFHALTRNGWRSRQHEPAGLAGSPADPVDAFRRDPLGAPIPDQVLRLTGRGPARRRSVDTGPETSGRHHQFIVPIGRGHR